MEDVTLRHEIETDEDTYWWKIVFDEAFNKKMYVGHMHFPEWSLLESTDSESELTRKVRVEPEVGNLPGPVKKVLGDKLSYLEEGTFDKKTKRYRFKVTPSSLADRTKVAGEMWVETLGPKKIARMCKISVEVKVFAIGGMVEKRIADDLRGSYDRGTAYTNDYLENNAL